MNLTLGETSYACATLHMGTVPDQMTITVQCENAPAFALKIARAVNRDGKFEALVAALTPFRSNEMGGLLVDMIDTRELGGEEAQKRLSKLVSMIDVILDAVELEDALA
jgi:hypothetical protein